MSLLVTVFLTALTTVVVSCGRGPSPRPLGVAELQETEIVTDLSAAAMTGNRWRIASAENPLSVPLRSGENMIFQFHGDYSGEVLVDEGSGPQPYRTFRWAADWQASYLSLRYDTGLIVDYDALKDGLQVTLRERFHPENSYQLAIAP